MPLDQAVYLASTNKIYGVRGPWVFKFSTSGILEDSAVFCRDVLSDTSIVAVGSQLFAATWRGTRLFFDSGVNAFKERDIFSIDPATLIGTPLQMWTYATFPLFALGYQSGYRNLVTDGTLVYGQYSSDLQCRRFRFNPANIVGTFASNGNDDAYYGGDMTYDPSLSCLVFTVGDMGGGLAAGRVTSLDSTWSNVWTVTMAPGTYYPIGVCYSPVNSCWYCTANTQADPYTTAIIKVTGDGASTTIPYAVVNANAHKLKYDSVTQRIYIPNLNANSVSVFNPATDTVEETKTGFSMPWDVVFTPAKRFAVQLGSQALKEIV